MASKQLLGSMLTRLHSSRSQQKRPHFATSLTIAAVTLTTLLLAAGAAAQTPIELAVKKNDVATLERILRADPAAVNSRERPEDHLEFWGLGGTQLMRASNYGFVDIAKILIAHGADVNAIRNDGVEALTETSNSSLQIAEMLVAAGADVNHVQNSGESALYWASDRNHGDICEFLIDHGAFINQQKPDGWSPLHAAVRSGSANAIVVLLSHHADLDSLTTKGDDPLHIGAIEGRWSEIQLLMAAGANPNSRDALGNTALGVAAIRNKPEIVRSLISYGADPSIMNNAGKTPEEEAQAASSSGTLEVFKQYRDAMTAKLNREEARRTGSEPFRRGFGAWSDISAVASTVYSNNFSNTTVGTEWKADTSGDLAVSTTPAKSRRFLGPFRTQNVRLVLTNLPPHKELSISYELFILGPWRGTEWYQGPNIWSFRITDGPTLYYGCFANSIERINPNWKVQTYPGEYPGEFNPVATEALERNTLGFSCDTSYKMEYTVAHIGSTLQLEFDGSQIGAEADQTWGIAHIRVAMAADASVALAKAASKPALTVHSTSAKPGGTAHITKAVVHHVGAIHLASAHRALKKRNPTQTAHSAAATSRLHALKQAPGQ